MTTPGSGDQPPQDPAQGWGQQPPGGQPGPPQQPGQPQQFGQPQQPGQPQQFGQPGQPQQGQPWGGQQAFGQAPQQEKSGVAKLLPIIAGVVALIVVAVLAFTFLGGGDPEVGDCVQQTGTDEVETVECDSSDAQYKVVGIDEERDDLTYAEFLADNSTCSQFSGITQQLWYGTEGNDSEGTIYCLGDV